jgi:hypothetical protein
MEHTPSAYRTLICYIIHFYTPWATVLPENIKPRTKLNFNCYDISDSLAGIIDEKKKKKRSMLTTTTAAL